MEADDHILLHLVAILCLAIVNYFLLFTNDWLFLIFGLMGSFIISPDWDTIFNKLAQSRHKILAWVFSHLGGHRHWFFHSALLPLAIYYPLRNSIHVVDAGLLSLWFFFPVIVHLLGDFKMWHVLEAMVGDAKEYAKKAAEASKSKRKKKIDISDGDKDVGGMWQINLEPFTKKMLGFYGSVIWLAVNISCMILFVLHSFGAF